MKFHDFMTLTTPYLVEKMKETSKLKEADLEKLFAAFDTDRSGSISTAEFHHMTVNKMEVLDKKEANALIKVLDTNGDGEISYDEFREISSLLDSYYDAEQFDTFGINSKAHSALRKLHMGVIPDPYALLQAFVGVPSSYRTSVIAPLDKVDEHTLKNVLTPQYDDESGIGIKDMDIKVISKIRQFKVRGRRGWREEPAA